MLAELGDRLLREWDAAARGPVPRSLAWLLVSGRPESATLTLLGFPDGARRPALAVKVHRERDAGDRVRAEAEVLRRLAGHPAAAPSVPRIVVADRVCERWVVAQTAVAGEPMAGGASDVGLTLGWLERLHGQGRLPPTEAARRRLVDGLATVRASFALDPTTERYVRSIDVDRALACGAFIEHGDLAPHNVLRHAGGIAVIDWTDATLAGLALHDAFFFLTWTHVLGTGARAPADLVARFADVWLDEGPRRDAARALVQRHASALGVDRDAINDLFAAFLAMTASAEATRMRRAHTRGSWSMFALATAAAEGIGADRLVEAQPWIRFLRATATRGGPRLT